LIVLEYYGGKGAGAPLAVVGKAVTFDTGGISLKPSAKMEEMKFDMSGGAAVLGLMKAAAGLKLSTSIVGIIPAAENMPSGTAQRPGDVIKTAKGLTVEVINTDAEGRLILADALHYAERFEPTAIIDLATLTGACVVALGSEACGLLGNHDKWVEQVRQAGERVGERAWKLPLWPGYHEMLKSPVADLRNIGDRPEAGTITGACFLSKFVGDKRKWAHLDIAGTAWDPSGRKPYAPKGAVGFGVRLLARLARDMGKKKG
ncbi:MAG: leucyl aminopeptidase, partial [Magnetococcales bacterium]|nr:leucyl aminopeptidase [Magnetococcales bacterium]